MELLRQMLIALFAATILMAESSPALQAATTTAPTQPAVASGAKTGKDAGNVLICRNEPIVGSRLPTKRCRTKEQMAAQKQEDQMNLEKMQRTGDPGH
jgi:hypothetical protein